MREENILRVFENRMLRRMFTPGREEVSRAWRKLYNKGLSYIYWLITELPFVANLTS